MPIYPPLRNNDSEEFEQPFDIHSEGVAANGFYPQNSTSNDAAAGLERDVSGNLILKDTANGSITLTTLASASGTSRIDFLLDNEPIDVNITYTPTYTSSKLSQEEWKKTADNKKVKTIDYTYTGTKLSTEVRKVYGTDGTTVVGQVTVTYSYSGSSVSGATYVRDV